MNAILGHRMQREPEIFCPQCEWRPKAEDRWSCMPSCGAVWKTVWTGGDNESEEKKTDTPTTIGT